MSDPRALIARLARQRGLDPAAVLSIASVEGGFNGAVGDHGTSFGPFQLHKGGALPAGIANPQQWANSPQGITYAEDAIARVAKGLRGKDAITAISSKFERPADVPGEISKAAARYQQFGQNLFAPVGNAGFTAPSTQAAPMGGGLSGPLALAMQLVTGNNPQTPLLQLAQQRLQFAQAQQSFGPTPSADTSMLPTATAGDKSFQLPFVGSTTKGEDPGFLTKLTSAAKAAGATQIRVNSGRRDPAHNAAVGGVSHSNHLTGHALDGEAFVPGKGWVPLGTLLKRVAPKFGLRSGDVPGFYRGGTDPVHVDDGFNQGVA